MTSSKITTYFDKYDFSLFLFEKKQKNVFDKVSIILLSQYYYIIEL